MLQAELRVVGGKHHNQLIPLSTPKFLIGREHDCQLRPNSESVSRHHCVFTVDEYTVRLRDLGSTNGTFVNDDQIRGQVVLQSGDKVTVGKLEFYIEINETQDSAGNDEVDIPDAFSQLEDADSETMQMLNDETISSTASELEGDSSVHTDAAAPDSGTYGSDTTIIGPGMIPGQGAPPPEGQPQFLPGAPYGMQPQYMPPYGMYPPPGYPGYGYPPMPGYMPQGYQQQPMYPQYPQYPQQGQQQTETAPPPEKKKGSQGDGDLSVRLPDPETSGYVAPPPPPPPAEGDAKPDAAPKSANPSEQAADIIKKFMQRRPGPKE